MRPLHTCPEESASVWNLMSVCDDGSVGAGDVAIIVGVLVAVAVAGVAIWLWVRKRMDD